MLGSQQGSKDAKKLNAEGHELAYFDVLREIEQINARFFANGDSAQSPEPGPDLSPTKPREIKWTGEP